MTGGHGLGGACGCIKALLDYPYSHIKGNSVQKACCADVPYVRWGGGHCVYVTAQITVKVEDILGPAHLVLNRELSSFHYIKSIVWDKKSCP